jgi:DNA invertase Pin-like site-specific DNA recombinase
VAKISKNELIKLQKSLQTDEAIGKKFGITRQAIHQFRQKYGIPAILEKNADRNAKILSMQKKGVSAIGIAKKMGLSVSQTYRLIRTTTKKINRKKK